MTPAAASTSLGRGAGRPSTWTPDVEARGAALGGELGELAEARLRRQRRPVTLLAEHADDRPHLRERFAAGGLDGRQDGSGAAGIALGELLGGAGLHGALAMCRHRTSGAAAGASLRGRHPPG
jgi:hypothetical protein